MNGNDISPDDLLDVLITRAVCGKPSPWRIDEDFKWEGSFEATYEKGDKQILLWAIDASAQKGEPIPEWAAKKLHEILLRGVARGRIAEWEEAFGPIGVDQQRTIQSRRHMVAVWKKVRELNEAGCKDWEKLYEDVAETFHIGRGKAKEYYEAMQRFMGEHGSAICTELEAKRDRD